MYTVNPRDDTSTESALGADITKCKARHFIILNQIKKLFDSRVSKIRIAEIGAGVGHLGYLLSNLSRFEYVGYELSNERAEYCKRNGLTVINSEFKVQADSFDVVILDNVLEHVLNPKEIYSLACSSLSAGGVLIIIVPNRDDVRRFIPKWRRRHYWQPKSHIGYFRYSELKKLSKDNGLDLRSFSIASTKGLSFFWKIKMLLDKLGFHCLALYTYSVKD